MPRRFDHGQLKAKETPEGYLVDSPIVARTGILTYRNADGSERKELRLAEDVFNADSLASFIGKPITVNHPKGPVNKSNIRQLSIGMILGADRHNDSNVMTHIVIHEPDKIGANRELSLGYDVDIEETPGEYKGERYDAIQRNIRVNHLSIVPSARAGKIARLNLDSDEEFETEIEPQKEILIMPKIRLDNGCEYDAPQEVVVAMEKLRTDSNASAEKLKAASSDLEKITGERDTLKVRVDGLPEEIKQATAKAVEQVRKDSAERAQIEKVATSFKVDGKDKDNKQLKCAVIKAFNKDFDESGKSDDYINAAFDLIPTKKADEAMNNQRVAVNGGSASQSEDRKDGKETDPADAYRNSLGRQSD